MKPKQISTKPEVRIVNNILAHFYSPAQVEFVVPVTKRLARSKGEEVFKTAHSMNLTGKKGALSQQ